MVVLRFVLLCCCLSLSNALKIKQLRVPDIVNIQTANSAILDCDYELPKNPEGLVVKWFFDSDPNPVYQWITNRPPQALGILKNRLDLNYKATNQPLSMHRALNIKNLSLDLSGEYKCVVSSFASEDSMTKKMIVLDPPDSMKIFQVKEDEDSVTVICTAQETFPQPILNITYKGSPILENVETNSAKTDNGLYNVTQLITLKDESLEYPTDFICHLHIPDAQYSQQVEMTYYPGPETTTQFFDEIDNETSENLHYKDNGASALTTSTWFLVLLAVLSNVYAT